MTTPKDPNPAFLFGRFQFDALRPEHVGLIETLRQRHERIVVLLQVWPVRTNDQHPLDFNARANMLRAMWPGLDVRGVDAAAEPATKSANLDAAIAEFCKVAKIKGKVPRVYGSKKGLTSWYVGTNPTGELAYENFPSGAQIRNRLSECGKASEDFRAGVIWATQNQYPHCIPTVDIAIYDPAAKRVLLGRKPGESYWRFPGGYAEAATDSNKQDVVREAKEETGIELVPTPERLFFLDGVQIEDWRYKGSKDQVRTSLYVAIVDPAQAATAKAGDDLKDVEWFDPAQISYSDVMPLHHRLMAAFRNWEEAYQKANP